MSTAEIEVVEAFTSIGIAPDKAMSAAAALNSHGTSLRNEFTTLQEGLNGVKSELNVLKWMVGFSLAILVGLLFKALHG